MTAPKGPSHTTQLHSTRPAGADPSVGWACLLSTPRRRSPAPSARRLATGRVGLPRSSSWPGRRARDRAVAHTPHGGDEDRVGGVGLDLLSDPADVDGGDQGTSEQLGGGGVGASGRFRRSTHRTRSTSSSGSSGPGTKSSAPRLRPQICSAASPSGLIITTGGCRNGGAPASLGMSGFPDPTSSLVRLLSAGTGLPYPAGGYVRGVAISSRR